MTTAQYVRLGDVAQVNPGLASRPAPDDAISFLGMAAVDAETGKTTEGETRVFSDVAKGYTHFRDRDILLAKITPCFENGKIAQATLTHEIGVGSTEFHVIRPDPDRLDARFALHLLRGQEIRRAGEKRMTGSAGQRRVPEAFVADITLPLPPIEEQRRIAAILDHADALRAKRREALAHLDPLIELIFLDLFGDPNPARSPWPVSTVGSILDSAQYGTSGKAGPDGKYAVVRMGNLTATGAMDLTDLKYMNLDSKELDRFLVCSGDILFNRTNSPDLVGKTALFIEQTPMAYAGYLVRLRVNSQNTPEYLSAFMNTKYTKKVLRSMAKSIVGMANINAKEVQTIKIGLPPKSVQDTFATRLASVENQRRIHTRSLNSLDVLFASLQPRAFIGRL